MSGCVPFLKRHGIKFLVIIIRVLWLPLSPWSLNSERQVATYCHKLKLESIPEICSCRILSSGRCEISLRLLSYLKIFHIHWSHLSWWILACNLILQIREGLWPCINLCLVIFKKRLLPDLLCLFEYVI